MCGFSPVLFSEELNKKPDPATTIPDKNQVLIQEWISSLLANVDAELDEELARKLIKKTSIIHYNNLKMDEMLSPYIGDMEKFIGFIQEKWGWKVDYNKAEKMLIADENKNKCICPISKFRKDVDISAMCYCSEGFAEKMFSTVAGTSATAIVISSIRRGDERCKYKIVFA